MKAVPPFGELFPLSVRSEAELAVESDGAFVALQDPDARGGIADSGIGERPAQTGAVILLQHVQHKEFDSGRRVITPRLTACCNTDDRAVVVDRYQRYAAALIESLSPRFGDGFDAVIQAIEDFFAHLPR